MIKQIAFVIAVGSTLTMAGQAVSAGEGEAQVRQQVTEQTREQVYGWELMSQEERREYREKMRNLATQEEREQLRLDHHEKMKQRAKERGVELPDMPMPQGRGMGQGMGTGGGQGTGR